MVSSTRTERPPGRSQSRQEGKLGTRRSSAALVAALLCATSPGCVGYNPSAKRTAYYGNAVLVLGGGGALAADLLTSEEACVGPGCAEELSPITGPMVVGAVLITAGIVGVLFTLTRPTVKTSR